MTIGWLNRLPGVRLTRACAAGCGAQVRVAATQVAEEPTGPWFCHDGACRSHRDTLPQTGDGPFVLALRAVAAEVARTGLAEDLTLAADRRTRFFTPSGDDIVVEHHLVRQALGERRTRGPAGDDRRGQEPGLTLQA